MVLSLGEKIRAIRSGFFAENFCLFFLQRKARVLFAVCCFVGGMRAGVFGEWRFSGGGIREECCPVGGMVGGLLGRLILGWMWGVGELILKNGMGYDGDWL